jgi:hypothetical protein
VLAAAFCMAEPAFSAEAWALALALFAAAAASVAAAFALLAAWFASEFEQPATAKLAIATVAMRIVRIRFSP